MELRRRLTSIGLLCRHWPSYRRPCADSDRPMNPVDAFILAKLRELKIKQVGPASKPELLRRVTYDLTGLPPTTSELEAFLG